MSTSPLAQDPCLPVPGQPRRWIVATVVGTFVAAAAALAWLILGVPEAPADDADLAAFLQAQRKFLFLYTVGMMVCCGTIGGSLYDIRGLIKHSALGDFDPRQNLSYLLRPLAGGLCGLVAFFLLLGGALGFSASHDPVAGAGWISFDGRVPYLAVAFLAGNSSHVFMLKLKDISDAVFSTRRQPESAAEAGAPARDDQVAEVREKRRGKTA